ncbi:hypothetical protein F7725_028852 [Dissostichus mawsoni]|uniref:ADP-ribosyl cyclase/cyclic ADP-ribose hydrolase n=1 Tax=Dissostichus mawsoni TaxID=36200 RepID=A0A7J5XGY7_DISMA|nr:hypothetical protein F7725_028852 [Dissostichus mawsoni]
MNAYDSLVAAAPFEHACNKTLFWSKTKNLVRDLTKNRDDVVALEDTLLGSVLDGLTWCGKMGSSDFACEDVTVILDGSIDTPFNLSTTFATIEVKRIKHPKVKSLTVVIVPKRAQIKKCSSDPKTPIGKCW